MHTNNRSNGTIMDMGRRLSNIEKTIFWFTIVDILFLPYFNKVSVSFSVPLIFAWMLLYNKELFSGREAKVFFFIVLFMIESILISFVYRRQLRLDTSISTTIKRSFQYFVCFGYYFYYRHVYRKCNIKIDKILFWFIIYVAIFVVFFLLFPRQYAEIKMLIHPADNHTRRFLSGSVYYRFNFLWTDPNNIAYLMCGLTAWFCLNVNVSFQRKIIITILSAIIVLASASNGGMLILVTVLTVLILSRAIQLPKQSKIKSTSIFTVVFLLFIVYLLIRYTSLYEIIQMKLVGKVRSRFLTYKTFSNFSGGRVDDIQESFKYLNPLLLFTGSGKEGFSIENGHLYWIGMYGFPCYLGFLYIAFAKMKGVVWRKYIWIFPFFVAFTVNIAIGEFKWLAIYFLLLAESRYALNNADQRQHC